MMKKIKEEVKNRAGGVRKKSDTAPSGLNLFVVVVCGSIYSDETTILNF